MSKRTITDSITVDSERTKFFEGAFNVNSNGKNTLVKFYVLDIRNFISNENNLDNFKNFIIDRGKRKDYSFSSDKKTPGIEVSFELDKEGRLNFLNIKHEFVDVEVSKNYYESQFREMIESGHYSEELIKSINSAFKKLIGEFQPDKIDASRLNKAGEIDLAFNNKLEFIGRYVLKKICNDRSLQVFEARNHNFKGAVKILEDKSSLFKISDLRGFHNLALLSADMGEMLDIKKVLNENFNNLLKTFLNIMGDNELSHRQINKFISGYGIPKKINYTRLDNPENYEILKKLRNNYPSSMTDYISEMKSNLEAGDYKDFLLSIFVIPKIANSDGDFIEKMKQKFLIYLEKNPDKILECFKLMPKLVEEINSVRVTKFTVYNNGSEGVNEVTSFKSIIDSVGGRFKNSHSAQTSASDTCLKLISAISNGTRDFYFENDYKEKEYYGEEKFNNGSGVSARNIEEMFLGFFQNPELMKKIVQIALNCPNSEVSIVSLAEKFNLSIRERETYYKDKITFSVRLESEGFGKILSRHEADLNEGLNIEDLRKKGYDAIADSLRAVYCNNDKSLNIC